MKDRLIEFLRAENKSSAQLAEEIGVQPSGISHILSGRNNPSLDFVLKMLEKYHFLSSDWLLFGNGSMYKDPQMQTLFDVNSDRNSDTNTLRKDINVPDYQDHLTDEIAKDQEIKSNEKVLKVHKIVWFYDNNSFEVYYPKH